MSLFNRFKDSKLLYQLKRKTKSVTFALITSLLTISSAISAQELPEMGSSTARVLSVTQEQAIGDEYILMVRRYLPLLNDPLAVEYINNLGFRLVEQNPQAQDRRFYFFVVQDPSLNAFALPGGYIGTHTGLIAAADTESELAAVMGHEIAHVTQRHLARRMERQQQLSFPALASFIGGIIVASQNPEAGIGLMTTAQAGMQQAIINHTRENEKEADRIGIQSMSAAGFDPYAVAGFFEKVQLSTRYLRKPPEFLMTHPVTQTRIADARERARDLPAPYNPDSLDFQLIKTRLKLLDNRDPETEFKRLKSAYDDKEMTKELDLYAFGLLASTLQQHDLAIEVLMQLYLKRQRNLVYLVSLSEAMIKSGQAKRAIPFLEAELKTTPTSYPLIMTYATALIENDQPLAARAILLEHTHNRNAEPQIYQLLGQAQSLSGFHGEVHESQGQYLFHTGDLQGSLTQFELALSKKSDDPYAKTRIIARIDEIQKIFRARRTRH